MSGKNPRGEEQVKKKIKAVLDKTKAYYFMPKASVYGVNGVPDFIVCLQGFFIGIEAKAAGIDKPDPAQVKQIRMIKEAGGVSFLINADNVAELENLLLCFIETAH